MKDEKYIKNIALPQLRDMVEREGLDKKRPYVQNGFGLIQSVSLGIKKQLQSIGPIRLEEMRLVIFKQGWAHAIVNLVEKHFKAGDMFFLREGSLIQVLDTSEDIDLEGIAVQHDLLAGIFTGKIPQSFSSGHSFLRIRPKQEDILFMEKLIHQMTILVNQSDFNTPALHHLIAALICYAEQLFYSQQDNRGQHMTRNRKVFEQFLSLINQYATQQHTIDFYADRLCLSPHYLSAIIKRVSGITVKEWIDRSIITSIKVELRHSNKGIKQLANEMAFPNDSFFCKYFKRLTGLTPIEYKTKEDKKLY